MKKRFLIGLSVFFGILLLVGITAYMIEGEQLVLYNPLTTKMTESKREEIIKQRQINFLKVHEGEMTAYIRKNSAPDMKVTYEWDSVDSGQSMIFSPTFLQITFKAKGSTILDDDQDEPTNNINILTITTDIKRLNRIDDMNMAFPYKAYDK